MLIGVLIELNLDAIQNANWCIDAIQKIYKYFGVNQIEHGSIFSNTQNIK